MDGSTVCPFRHRHDQLSGSLFFAQHSPSRGPDGVLLTRRNLLGDFGIDAVGDGQLGPSIHCCQRCVDHLFEVVLARVWAEVGGSWTGAPAGTKAVLVNLAMVDPSGPGYITADRCSMLEPGPQTKSSGNHPASGVVANLSVVPVDDDGTFCIYTQAAVQLVVDYQGSFAANGALRFTPSQPTRVLDARPPLDQRSVGAVRAANSSTVPQQR